MAEFMKDRVGVITYVSIGLLTLASFLQIIAVGTDHWVDTVTDYNEQVVGSSGLWKICTKPFNDRDDECRFFRWEDVQVSHWFRTVQALEVLGMVFGVTALLMTILFHFVDTCAENRVLKFFSIFLCILTFCKVLSAGVVIGALKDVQKAYKVPGYTMMSWSFGLSITACVFYLLAGGALVFS